MFFCVLCLLFDVSCVIVISCTFFLFCFVVWHESSYLFCVVVFFFLETKKHMLFCVVACVTDGCCCYAHTTPYDMINCVCVVSV